MDERFTGFGEEALDFYEGLAADNSKTYWQAHKDTYDAAVGGPLRALASALEEEFGPVKIFRPYRDVRFSKDKRPYQEHASLATGFGAGEGQDGGGHSGGGLYLSLHPAGLMLAGGYYQPDAGRLERFRRLQDDAAAAASLDATFERLAGKGFPLAEGNPVKTAPRGWPKDHPRIELLRRRSLVVVGEHQPGDWLFDQRCLSRIRSGWRLANEWNAWLDEHVGPA